MQAACRFDDAGAAFRSFDYGAGVIIDINAVAYVCNEELGKLLCVVFPQGVRLVIKLRLVKAGGRNDVNAAFCTDFTQAFDTAPTADGGHFDEGVAANLFEKLQFLEGFVLVGHVEVASIGDDFDTALSDEVVVGIGLADV